ncbi:unnamed protein product [Orchesella dallaii]|uniref:F-box domain-containing protein n=1 Tax=Orchesella dallaii TaxID=48710 RepID=A0ABP1R8P2_9HEXA
MEMEKSRPDSLKRVKLEENTKEKEKEGEDEKQSIVVIEETGTEDRKLKVARSPKTNPVLVPEIWEHVFRYLSRKEVITVINTCIEWNQLLDSKKTTLLLPDVLPFVLAYFDKPDLLLCRSISKTSKQIVDQTIQSYWISSEETFKVRYEDSDRFPLAVHAVSDSFRFTSKRDVETFIQTLNLQEHLNEDQNLNENHNNETNPFLTRSINILVNTPSSPQEVLYQQFFQSLQLLLTTYGRFIHRLNGVVWDMMNETQGITKMVHYLHQLPNLKILEITADSLAGEEIEVMGLPPLPSLEDLEYLDVSDILAESVATLFTQTYGTQLTTLVCEGSWLKLTSTEELVLKTLFPKLKRLRLEGVCPSTLSKLSNVNWPLEILHFDTFLTEEETATEIDKKMEQLILNAVRNFTQTLTQLEINADLTKLPQPQLADDDNHEEGAEAPLESDVEVMPKLKVLISEVSSMGSTLFWNFILSKCKKIEKIHFHTKHSSFENPMEVAKTAFDKLPNLEKIYFWPGPEEEDGVQRTVLTRATSLSSTPTGNPGVSQCQKS